MSNPEDQHRPDAQPEQPKFGQRSDNWSPNDAGDPSPLGPGGGSGDQDRPWPVYNPGPGNGAGYPQQPQGWGQPQVPAGMPQYGYGYPGTSGPTGGPVPGPGAGMPMPLPANLPSRTGAIITIVVGAVLAVLVAPAVLVGAVLTGFDFDSLIDGSSTVINGQEVTIDDTGTLGLMSQTGSGLSSCTLTDGSQTIELYEEAGSGVVFGQGIPAGTYTVDCNVGSGTALFAFYGDEFSGIYQSTVTGIIWATVIGLVGVVAVVVGIVWLVRRNGQRKEAIRNQWMGPNQ